MPNNLQAEASVLGAIMLDRTALGRVVGVLGPEDFHLDHHAQVYRAALSLNARSEPVDMVTLTRELEQMKMLDRIGGQAWLAELQNEVPTAANVEHYARLVLDASTKRKMIGAAGRMAAMARDDSSSALQLLNTARESLFDITETLSAGKPSVTRVGMGYRAEFQNGVVMGLERVRESRGEVHGELYIKAPIASKQTFPDGHLFGARFNVSSLSARTSVAKYLSSRLKADWPDMLERFCMEVLAAERKGEDFTTVGVENQPQTERWLLKPILLYGKTTILFGAGGSWKSTIGAACAVSVATGTAVVPTWPAHEGKVLVLDWEDGSATWDRRIRLLAIGAGQNPPEIDYRPMSRPLADELEQIAAHVSKRKIEFIVVDSVGLAAGTQSDGESAADGAFRLFAALRELKTTNLLIDHVAGIDLGMRGPNNKPYGSVYKVNLARSVFEVRSEMTAGDRCELLLLHTKTNSARVAPQEFVVTSGEGVMRFVPWAVTSPELKRALPKARKKG